MNQIFLTCTLYRLTRSQVQAYQTVMPFLECQFNTYDALGRLLYSFRSSPRFVDVARGEVLHMLDDVRNNRICHLDNRERYFYVFSLV